MSGPVKRYRLYAPAHHMVEDRDGYWIGRDDYEAVVRERDEAREQLRETREQRRRWHQAAIDLRCKVDLMAARLLDGTWAYSIELMQERDQLRALLDELRIAVMEMHHDNVKGDFELPPLARIDLDACVAKCSDERILRAGGSRELITLEEAVLRIVKEYGGIRAAARATNVDKAFISRLLRGLKTAPSNETLHKLGLEAVPLYVVLPRKRAERAGG